MYEDISFRTKTRINKIRAVDIHTWFGKNQGDKLNDLMHQIWQGIAKSGGF